jgi:HSP20 family protein
MSFLPRFAAGEFAPLFRLLDDYDVHKSTRGGFSSVRSWAPKFDVKEVKEGYQLYGELPGIEQQNIQIEFTDPHTLVIKGRTEREYSSGTDPTIEDVPATDAIEAAPEGTETPKSHQATVEDEDAPQTSVTSVEPTTESAVEKRAAQEAPDTPKSKYWVSERSVGEFHRTFSFPTRVDQDAVKASLKNGILSIVVPKATAPASKRITIE